MSSTWIAHAKDKLEGQRPTGRGPRRAWIGLDFSGEDGPRRARKLLPLLVFALIAALGVAALRIDLIRTRYAMAAAMAEEQALIEEQRSLIVRRRQQRDPVELALRARERGFRPLAAVFSLPDPVRSDVESSPSSRALPSVAARPPSDATRSDWR